MSLERLTFRLIPSNPQYSLYVNRNGIEEDVLETVVVAPGCSVHYSKNKLCGVTVQTQAILCPKCQVMEVHDHPFLVKTRANYMYVHFASKAYPRTRNYSGRNIVVRYVQDKLVGLILDLSAFEA